MRQILFKSFLLLLPFLMLLVLFFFFDPMKIFFSYEDPTARGVQMNDRIYQVNYLDNKPYAYDAFIFGSSKSYAFRTSEWEKYIGHRLSYHMGCNDESIYGIAHKLDYLVKEGYEVRNALMVFDPRLLMQNENPSAHIFREDPEVSGEPRLMFYRRFFTAFIQPRFLSAFMKYKDGIRDSSVIGYMNVFHFSFNAKTGDRGFAEYDSMLAVSNEQFYERQQPLFPVRDSTIQKELSPLIDGTTLELLKQIKATLTLQHTGYRIVIAPTYDQQELNESDLDAIDSVFGVENVFNFSGKNRYTDDINNYYEGRHFKPELADSLLKIMYR